MRQSKIDRAKLQKAEYADYYCIDVVIFKDGSFVVNMLDELNPAQLDNVKKIRIISTEVRK